MTPKQDGRPIFMVLADQIADDILQGNYPVGSAVPSTNELAAFYRINPATAGKALGRLVDQGVLERRRGIGTFVAADGPDILRAQRREAFHEDFIQPAVAEARRLGLTLDDMVALIRKVSP
ncbi:GntR family transcriptional regulator [Kocuria marina]|uniref:GntR family transcriptional regulator n=1 Tax=Kocuria marina TaxID=223184 RepID=UPI00345F8A17